ncbi:hypothetical protein J3R82DRAFT_8641 [Butyriboletus roseoflavus]|nr:hypothetical protein J3R82DRAFT_8641 [Butyriboletus roseoflavus]
MSILRVPSNTASSGTQGGKQRHLQENHAHALSTKEVDTGAQIVAGLSTELDPVESARVRCATVQFWHRCVPLTWRAHAGKRLIITSSQ